MAQRVVRRMTTAHDRRNGRKIRAEPRIHDVEETVRVLAHGEAIIDPVKLRVLAQQDFWGGEIKVRGLGVDRESCEVRGDLLRVWCTALGVWPPEEHVFVAQGEVEYDLSIGCLVGVGSMSWERIGRAEPLGTWSD